MNKQTAIQLVTIREAARQLNLGFSNLAVWIKQTESIATYQIGNSKAVVLSEVKEKLHDKIEATYAWRDKRVAKTTHQDGSSCPL